MMNSTQSGKKYKKKAKYGSIQGVKMVNTKEYMKDNGKTINLMGQAFSNSMEGIGFFKGVGRRGRLMERYSNTINTLIIFMKRRRGKCTTATYSTGTAEQKKMEKGPSDAIELKPNTRKESNIRQGDTIRMATKPRKSELQPNSLSTDLLSLII